MQYTLVLLILASNSCQLVTGSCSTVRIRERAKKSDDMVKVTAKVKTWAVPRASTNAKVYLKLIFKGEEYLKLLLDKKGYNDLQSGQVDEYSALISNPGNWGTKSLEDSAELVMAKSCCKESRSWTPDEVEIKIGDKIKNLRNVGNFIVGYGSLWCGKMVYDMKLTCNSLWMRESTEE